MDAYFEGVDFLELDLQVTKDHVMIVCHDEYLNSTNNITLFENYYSNRILPENYEKADWLTWLFKSD